MKTKKLVMLRPIFILILVLSCLFGINSTHAQDRGLKSIETQPKTASKKRIALVIGNAAYSSGELVNPVNDARAIREVLEKSGFEVINAENASLPHMQELVDKFGEALDVKGSVGLFYFAGHGVQVEGRNFLIPVESDIRHEKQVRYRALDVGEVLAEMDNSESSLNIVILDACRNNPFQRGFRSASKGLASIDAPEGTIIAYSTAPGKTADDGTEENSPYTKELVRWIAKPGLRIEDVFINTRVGVKERTNRAQIPWESTSLEGVFYFNPVNDTGQNTVAAEPESLLEKQIASLPHPEQIRSVIEEEDIDYNPGTLYQIKVDGKYGFINREGEVVIEPRFNNVYDFSEGLAVIEQDGKWGYMNKTGEIVIEASFVDADDFVEGLAPAMQDGKWGFIDKTGTFVIKPEYTVPKGKLDFSFFSEGLALVEIDGKFGYIDKEGNITIKPAFEYAEPFSEGLADVKINGKEGFIDRSGKVVIEPAYDSAGSFSEDFAKVSVKGKYGFIDKSGAIVIEPAFDYVEDFREGLAEVLVNGKYGYIDPGGKLRIKPVFNDTWSFHEGRAAVEIDGKYGFIDKSGAYVTKPQFDWVWNYREGLTGVYKDGKLGFIDKKGEYVWKEE